MDWFQHCNSPKFTTAIRFEEQSYHKGVLEAQDRGITPRTRAGTLGVLGCWWEQLGRKWEVWAVSKAKDLQEAQPESPRNICGSCSLQLVAAIGKCSDFKTFSGICARKLGCMTFRAKFRITSISHSSNTFYDNISKPFMSISYSSLSSFEMENRIATLLATNRAMNVDLLMVTEENWDGGLVWKGERRKKMNVAM